MCEARNSKAEKAMTAMVGGTVTLPCRTTRTTPVDWHYQPSENARGWFICSAGNIINGYISRFALDRSVHNDYGLIILSVTRKDAGVYICRENIGEGPEHRITLTVHGKIF